jgi:hypothetical protein
MPSASAKTDSDMEKLFGPDAPDEEGWDQKAIQRLRGAGYEVMPGFEWKPKPGVTSWGEMTASERTCMSYLFEEWDWGGLQEKPPMTRIMEQRVDLAGAAYTASAPKAMTLSMSGAVILTLTPDGTLTIDWPAAEEAAKLDEISITTMMSRALVETRDAARAQIRELHMQHLADLGQVEMAENPLAGKLAVAERALEAINYPFDEPRSTEIAAQALAEIREKKS